MKYVRTKDGIVKHPHPNAEVFTFRYEIVKQADTIEELCDMFISNYHQPLELESAKEKIGLYKGFAVYGAIWTDKGLIYVAKMNDKGELELL